MPTESVPNVEPTDPPVTAACFPHMWVEVLAFGGRFCARCGVDEDDYDDPRREGGCAT